jgi:uncharacterized lipoprotein YddW (UPF0748 family)
VSVIQDPLVLSSRSEISKLVLFAKQAGIRDLFVQIYYANKAWFPSKVGDPTPYETLLRDLGRDPFTLLISEAHASGIRVHAWLNTMSLNINANSPLLKKYGPSILTKDKNKKSSLEDYLIDGQYFLEPGDPRVRRELENLVEEVLKAYPELDGVQFDYIRYPDVHPVYGYAPANVARFREATGVRTIEEGSKLWQDWRRAQVTGSVELLVKKARQIRPKILVSVTGCMPYARAYYEAFQDWPAWLDSGLVDFVTVMNYSPDPETFEKWITVIKEKTRRFDKVNVAVGAYRLEKTPAVFAREMNICEKIAGGACVPFHYGSILQSPAMRESLLSRSPWRVPASGQK